VRHAELVDAPHDLLHVARAQPSQHLDHPDPPVASGRQLAAEAPVRSTVADRRRHAAAWRRRRAPCRALARRKPRIPPRFLPWARLGFAYCNAGC